MKSNDLYYWISETKSGSVRSLRDQICWMMGNNDQLNSRRLAGRWIRDAVTRGLLQADWSLDRWEVPPPILTTIPGDFGYALLTGGRPHRIRTKLNRALESDDLILHCREGVPDAHAVAGPASVYVEFQSYDELGDAAKYLGVPLVRDAFRSLASHLPPLECGSLASGPTWPGQPVEKWDSVTKAFLEFKPVGLTWPSGLYRHEVHGQKRHLLRRDDDWHNTDRANGVYLASGAADKLIRWRPEPGGVSEIGSVFVDNGASLPDEHRRVLGLCTGLPPTVLKQTKSTRYDNIPRTIAETVSTALRQNLTIMQPPNLTRGTRA
ncbi:hypothetical protein QM646_04375 [Rhodococcus erythropolis]|nr:hypothetical protein [Rhodococcus erythropolis]